MRGSVPRVFERTSVDHVNQVGAAGEGDPAPRPSTWGQSGGWRLPSPHPPGPKRGRPWRVTSPPSAAGWFKSLVGHSADRRTHFPPSQNSEGTEAPPPPPRPCSHPAFHLALGNERQEQQSRAFLKSCALQLCKVVRCLTEVEVQGLAAPGARGAETPSLKAREKGPRGAGAGGGRRTLGEPTLTLCFSPPPSVSVQVRVTHCTPVWRAHRSPRGKLGSLAFACETSMFPATRLVARSGPALEAIRGGAGPLGSFCQEDPAP